MWRILVEPHRPLALDPEAVELDEEDEGAESVPTPKKREKPAFIPVKFHGACMDRVGRSLGCSFIRESRSVFRDTDGGVRVVCTISKTHKPGGRSWGGWWFAFHPHQKDSLDQSDRAYVALGCGSAERLFLIPFDKFSPWLEGMWTTEREGRFYWHVQVNERKGRYVLRGRKDVENVDITEVLLPPLPED